MQHTLVKEGLGTSFWLTTGKSFSFCLQGHKSDSFCRQPVLYMCEIKTRDENLDKPEKLILQSIKSKAILSLSIEQL